MCAKGQILLEFSLMWIRLTCLLAFPMPWDHSDSTFHCPIEELYKEPFGYIEGRRNWEQQNYSPLLSELVLESASLCPLEHFCVLPKLAFCSWSCYREMEDWGGGGPSGEFSFSGSQTCRQRLYLSCNLLFILIETSFPSNDMYLIECCIHWNMSNAFTLLIIYARIDLAPWYIVCLYCLLIVVEIQACSRLISPTTINNWSCKIINNGDWIWSCNTKLY